ncbi:carbohydrate-binding module family 21 protein [Piedraia hortae CBS 480.64]|uniref:Carbohydrate-binding module family 21 protein n=1 Tax=Piedraia hortae CBS 480.64 TaxID=1314780 RepID=A0A6A7C4Y1_9PEZI|nr:carbohydrate-binding module family 21 protein [Piedraia hortae CBS 480.64]
MPFTPAVSETTSPVRSRASSYSNKAQGQSPKLDGRPRLPRSNSASYMHRQRRSPSLTAPGQTTPPTETTTATIDFAARPESTKHSPPSLNSPELAVETNPSTPESAESSGSDEDAERHRGRNEVPVWIRLRTAACGIEQVREGSPEATPIPLPDMSATVSVPQSTSLAVLTREARRISHSRSSTETAIARPKTPGFESSSPTEESEEETIPLQRPLLLRKKSGELVKPALRPSHSRRYASMPGTPTYKSVHFRDSDNQTRHFLSRDQPSAVSANTSPVDTYDSEAEFPLFADSKPKTVREVRLCNFPGDTMERRTQAVRLIRLFLSDDKQTLVGVVAVQNLHFHKEVHARFTTDGWKTTSEVVSDYQFGSRDPACGDCDQFNFRIKLSDQANIDAKVLLLCVRYKVNGQEYWDNNRGSNYRVEFTKTPQKMTIPSVTINKCEEPRLPRSRHTGPVPTTRRGRSQHFDDDLSHYGDSDSAPIRIRTRARDVLGDNVHPAHGLGGRYNFSASLSAALKSAQNQQNQQLPSGGDTPPRTSRNDGPETRIDNLSTDRPAMGSDQYQDLVQRFCYVGSSIRRSPTAST